MLRITVGSITELITSPAHTRAGFIEAALAKSEKARPYIEQARTLRSYAESVTDPATLKNIPQIKNMLVTASGLSDKALKYFSETDKEEAIDKLIEKYLNPAGDQYVDELIYRYLIIRGDSLGGEMRNYVGLAAQTKLTRKILSILESSDTEYCVLTKYNKSRNYWIKSNYEDNYKRAEEIAAISWINRYGHRVLTFNTKIPLVNNNVDICLFEGTADEIKTISDRSERTIMLGELKGGIDPAGADEHWKTGNSALNRIRTAYSKANIPLHTSFIAAAIENKMASEIWEQLKDGVLSNAANITVDRQLTMYCDWLINL